MISLTEGWNLVGYPAQTAHFVEVAIYDIRDYCQVVASDDPTVALDLSLRWDKDARDDLNTLTQMQPGRGYWVKVDRDCDWWLPYD